MIIHQTNLLGFLIGLLFLSIFLIFIWPQNYNHWLKFFTFISISYFIVFWWELEEEITGVDWKIPFGICATSVLLYYIIQKSSKNTTYCYCYQKFNYDITSSYRRQILWTNFEAFFTLKEILVVKNNIDNTSELYYSYLSFNPIKKLNWFFLSFQKKYVLDQRKNILYRLAFNFNESEINYLFSNFFILKKESLKLDRFHIILIEETKFKDDLKVALMEAWAEVQGIKV